MQLHAVASSFPDHSFSQADCLTAMREADFWPTLNERSRWVLEKVLTGESGIEKRHFALEKLSESWSRSAEELNNAYEKEAPALAAKAVKKAIEKTGYSLQEVDAVFLCSCTGFLCPGVTSYVAEKLGLREDVFLQDMTGLGCGAAVPLMRAAQGVIAARPEAVVVTVAVEICSAAFYVEDDFGVLISTCLFGDGASAAVWSGRGGTWEIGDFHSLHLPSEREKIRFTNAGGKLRNQLARSVPQLAAQTVKRLYEKRSTKKGEIEAWVTHGGGRDVIEALEKELPDLPPEGLQHAREVMQDYGNLSSPSVFIALEKFLLEAESAPELQRAWVCSFGAGFSAHSCQLYRL